MKLFKHIVNWSSKIVGLVAAAAFFFAPFTNTGVAIMAGSIMTGIACLGAYMWSEPDEEPENAN